MSHQRLTRRRLLAGSAGFALAGLAGCIGAPAGSANTTTGGTDGADDHSGGDDQPGHASEEHGHDLVSEPKGSREVVVNTARFEDSTEYHFDPHVTWVDVGGTVTWRLESGAHTATAYHPQNDQPALVPADTEAWDSGMLSETGETFEQTFETEGVYHYFCKPHEQFGMVATVIVGQPHPEDQRALGGMPAEKPETVHGKLEELNGMVREAVGVSDHDGGTDHHETEDGHHEEGPTTEDGHHEEENHTEV